MPMCRDRFTHRATTRWQRAHSCDSRRGLMWPDGVRKRVTIGTFCRAAEGNTGVEEEDGKGCKGRHTVARTQAGHSWKDAISKRIH